VHNSRKLVASFPVVCMHVLIVGLRISDLDQFLPFDLFVAVNNQFQSIIFDGIFLLEKSSRYFNGPSKFSLM
jgi:hypothetical protein